MHGTEKRAVRVAILDLYEGAPNQGMRCIRTILKEWSEANDLDLHTDEFDVRLQNKVPDTSYDIYISTGGPGDPLITRFDDWDISWCRYRRNTSSLYVTPSSWPAAILMLGLYAKENRLPLVFSRCTCW